jgi:hypothetical protein
LNVRQKCKRRAGRETDGADYRSVSLRVWLLRLAGVITASAFVAILIPVDWMAATHRWLGLGEFPRAPVVVYLARSIAALYGFHGLLLLLISTDPVRYRVIIWFAAFMIIAFGLIVLAIDLHTGMPAFWTIGEGPPIVALGTSSPC